MPVAGLVVFCQAILTDVEGAGFSEVGFKAMGVALRVPGLMPSSCLPRQERSMQCHTRNLPALPQPKRSGRYRFGNLAPYILRSAGVLGGNEYFSDVNCHVAAFFWQDVSCRMFSHEERFICQRAIMYPKQQRH